MKNNDDMMFPEAVEEQPQALLPNRHLILLPKYTVFNMLFINIAYLVIFRMHLYGWKAWCRSILCIISHLLLISNGIQELKVNIPSEMKKWRRLCAILMCLLVAMLPATIYHDQMEPWFKKYILFGSEVVMVIIVALHVTFVEFYETRGNIATQPRQGYTMHYIVANIIPICIMIIFATIHHPWTLFCSTLLCGNIVLLIVILMKVYELSVLPYRQAELVKWKWKNAAIISASSFPVILLLYLDP